jgi:predicted nucleic acid-binding protein
MYLIDTNVVSELRLSKSRPPDPRVVAWTASVSPLNTYLSVVSVLELEKGILSMERRDKAQGAVLRQWLDKSILIGFAGRILPVSLDVARRCAALHVPMTRPDRDAWIAATALVQGMTVVTRNVADFQPTGVPVLNPWEF